MVLHGFPRKVVWNEDAASAIHSILSEEGISSVVVVTDNVVGSLEGTRNIVRRLEELGYSVDVYSDVEPEPPFDVAEAIAERARRSGAKALIAIGGGSVIDAAKAALVRLARPDTDLQDVAPFNQLGLDASGYILIAVPTTSGTGSDASHGMVLTRVEDGRRKKIALAHYDLIPYASILDPSLPAAAPRRLALWTALDALSHALEALASTGATPISDALALQAAEIIFTKLKDALGGDREAIASIHAAATMAGMAFTNGGLGLAHAIAHPLGAALGTHHGATVGVVITRVVKLNYSVDSARAKYERLRAILESVDGLPRADSLVEHLDRLYREVGAPRGLRDLGVDRDRLRSVAAWVAEEALHDPDIAYAPLVPGPEDLEKLILDLY